MINLEENFKWHLEAFASELFIQSFRDKVYGHVTRNSDFKNACLFSMHVFEKQQRDLSKYEACLTSHV